VPDARPHELAQFAHQRATICATGVADVEGRAERVDEAYPRRPRHGGGGAQLGEDRGGIGVAPAIAMPGVVLRPVDEGVHAVGAEEADDVLAGGGGPGAAVVALDDARAESRSGACGPAGEQGGQRKEQAPSHRLQV
jgi:hypothetical protein